MSATTIIVNDESPRRQYTATSGQTVFDFPLPFFEQGDLTVYLTPVGQTADDAADLQVITTNYTVTGENTQDGGKITLTVGATTGDIITIDRVVDLERLADYQNSGDLLAETLNREQDTEIMISQQLREDLNRSIKRSSSSTSTADLTLPEPEASKHLQWNSTATALENANPDQAAASQIYDTVADLKTQSIVAGFSADTRGYTTAGDGGGAIYLIQTAAEFGGTPDGHGDHTLANGNVAVLQFTGEINVKQYGAAGDGVTDDTLSLNAADATGLRYVLVNDTFVYDGDNLPNIDNMRIDGATINDTFGDQCIYVDESSNKVIGLMHNYKQFTDRVADGGSDTAQTTGNITTPPPAQATMQNAVNIAAFWYQDFGLERTRAAGGALGDLVWYYWLWNFSRPRTDIDPLFVYDSNRHPTVGYYRGDDPKILGWQCYWLSHYGVNSVLPQVIGSITATSMTADWATPSHPDHWFYQYLVNTPNSRALKYGCWGDSASSHTTAEITNSWTDIINNIYANYRNYLTVTKAGKTYAVFYVFDGEAIRGVFDSFVGETATRAFYTSMATAAQTALGVDGIYIMARIPTTTLIGDPTLEAAGVLYAASKYELPSLSFDDGNYSNLIDHLDYKDTKERVEIMTQSTSADSQYPHPSAWIRPGSTGENFSRALKAAINQINAASETNLITIYNTSEWAEGGAGLMPTVGSGYEYLNAIKKAVGTTDANTEEPAVVAYSAEAFAGGVAPVHAENMLATVGFDNYDASATTPEAITTYGVPEGTLCRVLRTATGGRLFFTTASNIDVSRLAATSITITNNQWCLFVLIGGVYTAVDTNGTLV